MSNTIYFNRNNSKKLIFFLKETYGLGILSAKLICKIIGYDINVRCSDINDKDWDRLSSIIKIKYKFLLENEVKKTIHDNIQFLKDIKCYKGVRHSYNLPVNGQRTKTNAKTRGWR